MHFSSDAEYCSRDWLRPIMKSRTRMLFISGSVRWGNAERWRRQPPGGERALRIGWKQRCVARLEKEGHQGTENGSEWNVQTHTPQICQGHREVTLTLEWEREIKHSGKKKTNRTDTVWRGSEWGGGRELGLIPILSYEYTSTLTSPPNVYILHVIWWPGQINISMEQEKREKNLNYAPWSLIIKKDKSTLR